MEVLKGPVGKCKATTPFSLSHQPLTKNSSMSPPHEGSIGQSIRTMSERSHHGATSRSFTSRVHLCAFVRLVGARCSSVVRAFSHGAMGHRIDPSWGGPIELFLVPAVPAMRGDSRLENRC